MNWNTSTRKSSKDYIRNRHMVRQRDEGHCFRCWHLFKKVVVDVECDHFIPISQGGPDDFVNLWLLCKNCHKIKTARESRGLKGFGYSVGLDGWPVEDVDWLALILEKNKAYIKKISGSI